MTSLSLSFSPTLPGIVTPGSAIFQIGDSITANGMVSAGIYNEVSQLLWAAFSSSGALAPGGVSGTGGFTATQVQTTHLPVALASNAPAVLVLAGTNDTTAATAITALRAMYTAIAASGKQPIAATIPPRVSNRTETTKLNAFIRRYALLNGIPMVDFHAVLCDPATGDYLSGLSGDSVHPNLAGVKIMGQAMATSLVPSRAPFAPQVCTDNADGVFANGCFLASSSGVPTGFVPGGTGSAVSSIITGDATIVGNWWQLAKASGTGTDFYSAGLLTVTPGDIIGFGFKVQYPVFGAGSYLDVSLIDSSSSLRFVGIKISAQVSATGIVTLLTPVPAGTTSILMSAVLNYGAAAATVKLAQMSVVNYTALGLL